MMEERDWVMREIGSSSRGFLCTTKAKDNSSKCVALAKNNCLIADFILSRIQINLVVCAEDDDENVTANFS